MLRRLLNGVLHDLILLILVCVPCLVIVELVPNVSIKSMMRLFFATCVILELLILAWMVFYLRKKYPDCWVALIYPEHE